jgi:hypothetical protein
MDNSIVRHAVWYLRQSLVGWGGGPDKEIFFLNERTYEKCVVEAIQLLMHLNQDVTV